MEQKLNNGTKMKDGNEAWVTQSGNYHARRHPTYENYTHIFYYDLEGNRILLAKATCPSCEDVLESKMCGDFVSCRCGKSFVDTDRCMPERHRFGGLVANINI